MKIGVISEGHADRAVITNIIKGITGLDENNIEALRPIYSYDETDKALKDVLTFSSWTVVREECQSREMIDGFLAFEGQDFIVIHIDTAEAGNYGITRPVKDKDYCLNLRNLVKDKINEWFGNDDISDSILYAIAIEETDAWLLTFYEKRDSALTAKPKEKLQRVLGKKSINSNISFENYSKLSKFFLKQKMVEKERVLDYNCSLQAFFDEIHEKVLPKLEEDM